MNNTSNLSNVLVPEYYVRKLLVTAQPRLVLQPLGVQERFPKGQGKTVAWRRFDRIAGSTSPLTEGVAPADLSISVQKVTAQLQQYGQWAKFSDFLDATSFDPVISKSAENFGKAAAETIEKLIVAELDSQAFIQRVNDKADDDSIVASDLLNHKELIEAMIAQEKDFIGPHESGDYIAVLHPSCKFDLITDTQAGGLLDISKFVPEGRRELMNGEFARMYGIRLLVSDAMTEANNASNISVKKNYLIGEEAYGVVSLDRRNVEMIIKPLGSGGTEDPLNQVSSVGYKILGYATKYLEAGSKRVIQIRSASALP